MTYRAGVIGAGRIGRIHADMYRNTDGVELAALAEIDSNLLSERADMWEVDDENRYRDYSDMLANEDLDVVSVSTPSAFHYEPVIAAAQSEADPGVIFCEKPVANSPAEAYEMAQVCGEAGTELVVDHTLRFSETFRSLRRLLHEEQIIGDIQSIQIHASGSLMRLGTHYVDLLQYLLDASPVSVRGGYLVESDDTDDDFDDQDGAGTIVFDDGTVAMLDETRSSPVANSILLVGTEGMISARGSDASSIYSRTFEWRYWATEDREHVEQELPESLEQCWEQDMSTNTSGFDSDAGMYGAQQMFNEVAEHIVALLDGEESNRSSGHEAAVVVETLAAIFLSHDTDSHVSLPLSDRLRSVRIRSE